MAFGQQLGPPASAAQLRELLALLQGIGYADFRVARGPMGFSQRQGGGKFTRDEAAAFIEQLQNAESEGTVPVAAVPPGEALSGGAQLLARMPTDELAAELQRRGWIVMEP
jgi:hypothetical protein